MKGLLLFLLIGILSFVAGLFYPWWTVGVVAFVIALVVPQKHFAAFFTAFLSIFILWFSLSYFKDLSNDHILSSRMSLLFIKTELPAVMCLITGMVGGLVAGLAALSASFLRKKKKRNKGFKPSYV